MSGRLHAVAAAAGTAVLLALSDGQAEETVDVELILAVDVSGSIDEDEARLQRQGYIDAIMNALVIDAIKSGPLQRIALTYFEWSGDYHQRTVVDWMVIDGERTAQAFTQALAEAPLVKANRTSISAAIDYAMAHLGRSPYQAPRRVIDVSGDGTNNSGRPVTAARDDAVAAGVTINGLVILSEVPLPTNPRHTHPEGGLTAYYENNVIGGPGAFVVEAESFEAFGQLLISKLIKEIAAAPMPPRG
jgi:hypothetical protein